MDTAARRLKIENRLKQYCTPLWLNGAFCFPDTDGGFYRISAFPGGEALVLEFAENMDEARINRFEDGDLFRMNEMDEDTMFQAILEEICPESTLPMGLNIYQLTEVVENLKECADELLSAGRENLDLVQTGQLIGIAQALQILRENTAEENLKAVGLDFDIDAKYLY